MSNTNSLQQQRSTIAQWWDDPRCWELLRARGGRANDPCAPFVYDPLSTRDREAVDGLLAGPCDEADHRRISEILAPYADRVRAGVSLWPKDASDRCLVPPNVRVVRIYDQDGSFSEVGADYDELVCWLNVCGFRVTCEQLFNGDSIVHEGKGYTLVESAGEPVCTFPTLTEARELHHVLHPL